MPIYIGHKQIKCFIKSGGAKSIAFNKFILLIKIKYYYNFCIKAFTSNNVDLGDVLEGYTLSMDGKIDMLITKSISRFARNTVDCLNYIRMLKDINIPVFFEKENTSTAKVP